MEHTAHSETQREVARTVSTKTTLTGLELDLWHLNQEQEDILLVRGGEVAERIDPLCSLQVCCGTITSLSSVPCSTGLCEH